MATLNTVSNKLNEPIALGYSNVGIVREVGEGVSGFKVGDRIVSNGPHAEVVSVPVNLCASIPEYVQKMDLVVKLVQILKGRNIQFILRGEGY